VIDWSLLPSPRPWYANNRSESSVAVMAETSEVLAARARLWRSAARYRRLSLLLQEVQTTSRLMSVARGIDAQLSDGQRLAAAADEFAARTKILIAEIEAFLMQARRGADFARRYSPEDVLEEARVCLAEAEAAEDLTTKRSVASSAFSLAQLAEAMKRDGLR